MSRVFFAGLGRSRWGTIAGVFFAISVAVLAATPAAAAEPVGRDDFAAQLAAGEFAPARAAVDHVVAPALRAEMLADLSAAQGAAGARRAALDSASAIDDDLARNSALDKAVRQGGGVQPDFDALIELIESTIAPTTWANTGGTGAVQEFESGVHIDAAGTARRKLEADRTGWLAELRGQARHAATTAADVRVDSPLRKVSLTRLEREVQLRLAAGEPLDEAMALLAGLSRIQYVFVYPDTGDIVLAGPAGDWRRDDEGRIVNAESGRPIVRLTDLVCLLRAVRATPNATLRCSIDPRAENLAAAQEYLNSTSGSPLKPNQRDAWLENVRSKVGLQDVRFRGIDPRTRVARIMFEADYRMKLVGIGLEESAPGVRSYLDLVSAQGKSPSSLDVLRWWFTMNYSAVAASDDRLAFELRGEGVQVQSENEFLAAQGERVHTGQSGDLNQEFASSFTREFAELAEKYPIYAELQNVFDVALVAALLESQHVPDQVGWHLTCFDNPRQFVIPLGSAPQTVESVANLKVVNRRQIVAAVSGGVRVDPYGALQSASFQRDASGQLGSAHHRERPATGGVRRWWWD